MEALDSNIIIFIYNKCLMAVIVFDYFETIFSKVYISTSKSVNNYFNKKIQMYETENGIFTKYLLSLKIRVFKFISLIR